MTSAAYAPPRANLETHSSGDAAARMQLLRHEKSIRAIGSLHLLGAILSGAALPVIMFQVVSEGMDGTTAGIAAVLLGICALHVWLGLGLRRLDSRVLGIAGLVHGIGLLGIPAGTLINGYILYLLFGQKGKQVFSDEYRALVARTPDVRLPTSMVSMVLLGLLVAGLVAILIAVLLHG